MNCRSEPIDNKYRVVENKTNIELKTNLNYEEAKALAKFINFGGGFDGFTPAFMTSSFKVKL